MTEKILVTGASGFIGTKLVEELVNEGYSVTSLVRFKEKGNQKTKIIIGDLTDRQLKIDDNFDTVFHLASHTPLEKNKKTLKKVNLDGTKNLFSAINGKTKHFVYISGLGVFGEPNEIVDENSPLKANTDFVKIRLEAQKFLEEECKNNQIQFATVFFGDVYGKTGWFNDMLVKRLSYETSYCITTPIQASNEKIKKIYDFKFPEYKKGIDSILS